MRSPGSLQSSVASPGQAGEEGGRGDPEQVESARVAQTGKVDWGVGVGAGDGRQDTGWGHAGGHSP